MQTKEPLTCELLEKQYKALQDTADEYRAILMSEGYDAEKTKELRTTFDTETEKLRESIARYKVEKQEGIFYLSAEYRSGEEYIEALEARGYITHEANYNLRQYTNIPEEQVRLKRVTARDLGVHNSAGTRTILAAVKKKGLTPCPPWVGPQYRMECDDDEHALAGRFIVSRNNRGDRCLDRIRVGYYWGPDDGVLCVSDK